MSLGHPPTTIRSGGLAGGQELRLSASPQQTIRSASTGDESNRFRTHHAVDQGDGGYLQDRRRRGRGTTRACCGRIR